MAAPDPPCRSTTPTEPAGSGAACQTTPTPKRERPSPTHAVHQALLDAGLDAGACEISAVSKRWLSQTYRVVGPELDAMLKIYRWDLSQRIAEDPDPRFSTLAEVFPFTPFFRKSSEPMDRARSVLPIRVPLVLAEGPLEGEVSYTLMSHLEGRSWEKTLPRSSQKHDHISKDMGRLLSHLHRAPLEGRARTPQAWLERFGEILHCLADHLSAYARRRHRRRYDYHQRFLAILDRLAACDLGPTVLAHCDFHPANLLFDGAGQICGLLDFQLACTGPAALDFRWLAMLDEVAFASAYEGYKPPLDQACWLGHCFDMFWQGLALVAMDRFSEEKIPALNRIRCLAHFEYLLGLCEDDDLRRGSPWKRWLKAWRTHARAVLRYPVKASRRGWGSAGVLPQVAIVIPLSNHLETTTRPCLSSLRRFTDLPYRLICVENGSQDGTRTYLLELAAEDRRVEVVPMQQNLGWAQGTLAGIQRLHPTDTHLLLLNSDTILSPGWLSKLLWHMQHRPPSTVIIPNESPLGVPGDRIQRQPPPRLQAVLQLAAKTERASYQKSQPAAPSGFCLLLDVADLDKVVSYLQDFERYHSGELDWLAWWRQQGLDCHVALDSYVFHARAGSGGYHDYRRETTR